VTVGERAGLRLPLAREIRGPVRRTLLRPSHIGASAEPLALGIKAPRPIAVDSQLWCGQDPPNDCSANMNIERQKQGNAGRLL